jgi:putative flippase GtrA
LNRNVQELLKAGRFAIVGVANTLVDFTVFTLLAQAAGVNVYLSQVLGYSAGILNSYTFNRSWTFRTEERFFSSTLARFLALNLSMLLFSTGILYLAINLGGLPKIPAKITATGVTMVVNFLVSRFWVFRRQREGQAGDPAPPS